MQLFFYFLFLSPYYERYINSHCQSKECLQQVELQKVGVHKKGLQRQIICWNPSFLQFVLIRILGETSELRGDLWI